MSAPITVVTATVNRPSLRLACESVQWQTLQPERHILLFQQKVKDEFGDYTDTDEPHLHLKKPSTVPVEVHWLPPPQPTLVEAYNIVESLARTPWIAMLDDDCWWEPDHLETLMALAEEKGADFVWGSSVLWDEQKKERTVRLARATMPPKFQTIDTNEILFRRENLRRWGGFTKDDWNRGGLDGFRIERWIAGGATYARSEKFTVNYTHRKVPEFVPGSAC